MGETLARGASFQSKYLDRIDKFFKPAFRFGNTK